MKLQMGVNNTQIHTKTDSHDYSFASFGLHFAPSFSVWNIKVVSLQHVKTREHKRVLYSIVLFLLELV